MRASPIRSLLCAALALAGCDLLLPFAPGRPGDASSSSRDGALRESGADAARSDASSSTDRGRGDGRPPAPADRFADRGDGPAVTTSACVSGGAPWKLYSSLMIHCDYGLSVFTQCQAAAHCNQAAGWHLCNALEYLQHGGNAQPPDGKAAWIGACVRDNGKLTGIFATQSCGSCNAANASPVEVLWNCDGTSMGGLGSFSVASLGVHTYGMCRRVGGNLPGNEGRWTVQPADFAQLAGAVCCR